MGFDLEGRPKVRRVYVGWSCVCVVVLGLGPNPSCCLRCLGEDRWPSTSGF